MNNTWLTHDDREVLKLQIKVEVIKEGRAQDLPLPQKASTGAAGFDLRAAVDEKMEIGPGQRCLVPTGLRVAIPPGYEGQVRPRSGLALKHGITVLNSPGTIDWDYRGEVKVILINLGQEPFTVNRGERIAQLVFSPVPGVGLVPVETLPETQRDGGGFGHSGTS